MCCRQLGFLPQPILPILYKPPSVKQVLHRAAAKWGVLGTGVGTDLAWVRGGRHFQLCCSGKCNTSPHPDFLQAAVLSLLCSSPPPHGADVLGSILSSPQAQEGNKSTSSSLLFVCYDHKKWMVP